MQIPINNIVESLEKIMTWHEVDVKHGQRTAGTAVLIGERLEYNRTQLQLLDYAARLHDFGRTGIDHELVRTHARYTDSERGAMERHCQIGFDMLKPAKLPNEITMTVLHHHERWDGSGYPRALKGKEIPLNARIVAVADVWDALRTNRPYRKAYRQRLAVGVMKDMRQGFDPKIFDIFMDLLNEGLVR